MITFWLVRPPSDDGMTPESAKEVQGNLQHAREEAKKWAKECDDTVVICKALEVVEP